MKAKKTHIIFCFVLLGFLAISASAFAADYQLLETVPGAGQAKQTTAFPEYVSGIYRFATGFVVVAALLMVTIGGFYYIMSAGNQAQAGTAKKIITDALLGLIVVFIAYLVLFTINPDLVGTSPNVSELQNSVKPPTTSSGEELPSIKHSDPDVVQEVTHPQTYCSGSGSTKTCHNSKEECEVNGGECKASQNALTEPNYYTCDGEGVCKEYKETCAEESAGSCKSAQEACEASGDDCMSAKEVKARMLNNVKSAEKVVEEAGAAGVEFTEEAAKDANKMTEKTVDAVKEVGGTVTKVDSSGAKVNMQGTKDPSKNGTKEVQMSMAAKEFEEMSKLSDHVRIVNPDGSSNPIKKETKINGKPAKIFTYHYEISKDHPNEKLRGATATRIRKHYWHKGKGYVNEFSDVKIVAAQGIRSGSTESAENTSQTESPFTSEENGS